MTQAVLKNEITELAPRSWMDADQRKEVAEGVANILADAYRLLINTQGLHWNVEGPMFYSLHKLTEDHYRELFESIDSLANGFAPLGCLHPSRSRTFRIAQRSRICPTTLSSKDVSKGSSKTMSEQRVA